MKTIIYASAKETIQLSFPDFVWPLIKPIWTLLKVKTLKPLLTDRRTRIKAIIIDEFTNYRKIKNI